MRHHEFWRLICLANIDPINFGVRNHLVSAVQQRGIRKKYGSTHANTILARREIEKKGQYLKRNLDMDMSVVTKKTISKKDVVTKTHRVNDDALQPGCALDR